MENITEEYIDELQLPDAVNLCGKLNLDIAKCKDINEVRDRLKENLKGRIDHDETSALQVNEPLERDLKKQQAMKKNLLKIYKQTSRLLASASLNNGLQELISQTNAKYCEKIAFYLKKLESEECPIVITGETSAGKSTLINLLIGEDILPCSVLHKTAALCCIRHSEEKRLAYKLDEETRECFFDENAKAADVYKTIDEIMKIKNFKSIDIYWPLLLLKNQVSVTLVDTPGLGENEKFMDILMKYLPNAVGFIYVINSSNGGGIEKHKVAGDRKNRGLRTTEFDTLLRELKVLVPNCVERKYTQLYRWLRKSVLESIYYKACTRIMFAYAPVKDSHRLQEEIEKRSKILRQKCDKACDEIQQKGDLLFANTAQKLSEYLHSETMVQKLCTWDESQCPSSICEELAEELEKAVRERIGREIVHWQTQEDTFLPEVLAFRKLCSNRCESLEKDVEDIRLTIEGAGKVVDLPKTTRKRFKLLDDVFDLFDNLETGEKIFTVITAPIWVPVFLVAGMVGLPVIGIGSLIQLFAKDVDSALGKRKLRNSYEKNKPEYLRNFTEHYLKDSITDEYLKNLISKRSDCEKTIAKIQTSIINQLEDNQLFLKSVVSEGDNNEDMHVKYGPVEKDLRGLLAQMMFFSLNYLQEQNVDESNVEYKRVLWHGTYGQVQEVQFCGQSQSTMSAALVSFHSRECIKIQEIDCLLNLNHDNIVRTYGVMQNSTQDTVQTGGVLMELCQGNAEALFYQVPGNVCSNFKDLQSPEGKQAFQLFLDISIGACEALKYTCDSGYRHGNLKLTKILITHGRVAKLTGMNSIRHEGVSINKSMSGLSHFAPEVLMGKPYRWASDVYSLGIALWEMWFGRRAFDKEDLNNQSPMVFVCKLVAGQRPDTRKETVPPDTLWKLMQGCLEKDLEKRPCVEIVLNSLRAFKS